MKHTLPRMVLSRAALYAGRPVFRGANSRCRDLRDATTPGTALGQPARPSCLRRPLGRLETSLTPLPPAVFQPISPDG